MRDLHNNIHLVPAIYPQSGATDNTAQVSQIIDRQGFDSLEFAILTGTVSDAGAQFTVLVEDGDAANLSDNAAVADTDLLGLEANASFTEVSDNLAFKIGYRGPKRYVRLTITPANNGSTWLIAAVAILARAAAAPTT